MPLLGPFMNRPRSFNQMISWQVFLMAGRNKFKQFDFLFVVKMGTEGSICNQLGDFRSFPQGY